MPATLVSLRLKLRPWQPLTTIGWWKALELRLTLAGSAWPERTATGEV
jgi:hypothetical protein